MPSPIAHSAFGYALTRLPIVQSHRQQKQLPGHLWPFISLTGLYSLLVANLPDLDFLPQLLTGINVHRGPSHSLSAAFIVSTILAWVIQRARPQFSYKALFLLTFAIYGSHLLFDFFTAGGSGIPLLWPFSAQPFISPFSVFPGVHHSRGLWDSSHLIFITIETLYSLGLFIALQFVLPLFKGRTQPEQSRLDDYTTH
ncbi:MAG: metal-dependent hydrolase [Phormidesmis sp.]